MKVRYRMRYIVGKVNYAITAMLSSCRISALYVVDDTYYDLSIASSKSHDSQTLRSGRLLDLDCDNRMIKEHTYSILGEGLIHDRLVLNFRVTSNAGISSLLPGID